MVDTINVRRYFLRLGFVLGSDVSGLGASVVGLGGEFLQPGAQFLLEELLVRRSVAGGHGGRRRLHQLMVTAEAGATAERRRRL